MGGRNIAYKGPAADGTLVLMGQNSAPENIIGFNDLTTDSAGRVYAGSLGGSPFAKGEIKDSGFLHMIDLDGSVYTLARDVKLTNGLGFSTDGKTLYHCDSRAGIIRSYDVNSDGSVDNWQVFATVKEGAPDGLAVAEDGSIWVAIARRAAVRIWNTDGSERPPLPCPLPMPTSLSFGGSDMRDLYIVTGSDGLDTDHGGAVLRVRTDVPGLPLAVARVPLG